MKGLKNDEILTLHLLYIDEIQAINYILLDKIWNQDVIIKTTGHIVDIDDVE